MNYAIVSVLMLLVNFAQANAAPVGEAFVVSESTVCHAKVHSENSIVLPGHCIQNPKTILFEDLGNRTIKSISPFGKQTSHSLDNLTLIELTETIFPQAKVLNFGLAKLGDAKIISSGIEISCRILDIDSASKTFTHDCADRKGQSGKTVYQNGQAVGIHLGQLRDRGQAVAAMKNGPDFSQNEARFALYEPQGLKISCCKKLEKALSNVGDAIADGAEAVKELAGKAAEAIKTEIKHLKDDIAVLPKVFSVNYVQDKVKQVRLPKVPEIKVDSAIMNTNFSWDLPDLTLPNIATPEIGRNSVIAKIGRTLDKAWEDSDRALTIAGRDIRDWPKDSYDWLKTLSLGINYGDDCATDASIDQKNDCIAKLEIKVKDKEDELKRLRGSVNTWVDQQSTLLNN